MKYIIVNSVAEGHRYIRRKNMETGNIMVNESCCHLVDLAKNLVIKNRAKKGILRPLTMAESTETVVFMEEIMERYESPQFFVPKKSFCFDTAKEVLESVNQIRKGKVTDAFENSSLDKIVQIKELIAQYEKVLKEKDVYDDIRLYQEALNIANEEDKNEYFISEECFNNLSYLEKCFLAEYTKGNYKIVPVLQDMKKSLTENLKEANFFKSYGMANEVNYVVANILEKQQKFGDVVVFYTNASYEPYLEACFSEKGMPYKMVSRQTVSENRYVAFMYAVLKWAGEDYSYRALKPVFSVPGLVARLESENGEKKARPYSYAYYKTIRAGIGWGLERYIQFKETADMTKEYNKIMADFFDGLIEVFGAEPGQPVSYGVVFDKLREFARKSLGNHMEYKDISAALVAEKKMLDQMDMANDMKTVVETLLERIQKICWSDSEENDSILVQKLDGNVHVLERKHCYFIGLSVAKFSKNSVDSPVLSDDELKEYLDLEAGDVKLKLEEEKKCIQALYKTLATKNPEGTISIGYSMFDTINLRKEAPAVCYLRMMEWAGTTDEDVVYQGYPNLILTDVKIQEKSLWKDENVCQEEREMSRIFSTTSLEQLIHCPLQYYYQRIAGISQEEYKMSDATIWLAANERGTLVHGILEEYCKKWFVEKKKDEISTHIQEESFYEIASLEISKMEESCPYLSKAVFELECAKILEVCKSYLENMHREFSDVNNKWIVKDCEIEFDNVELFYDKDGACEAESENSVNLCFNGKIDRLDYYVDEIGRTHYRIVDYKTGKAEKQKAKIENSEGIQHIVYSKAIRHLYKDAKVECVQFHHIFEEDEKVLNYEDDAIREFPSEVIELFVEVLLNNHYRNLENCDYNKKDKKRKVLKKSDCPYCSYKDICKERIGDEL